MKSRNIRYLTGEGIKNIGTNRLMSIASVAVLMSCLLIIGFALLLFLNVDKLLDSIQKQNIIMVYVNPEADSAEVEQVKKDIEATDNVAAVRYVSKEEAYNDILKDTEYDGLEILLEGDSSFLPEGFEVTVSDMSGFSATAKSLSTIENVYHIRENSELATKLENVRNAVTYICLGIIIILLVVSLFIIANTVRITMFSRRLEISIMKAVGATNWFVRWPFLIEGVSIGILSAVVSIGVLWLIYFFIDDVLLSVFGILKNNTLVSFTEYGLWIFIAYIAVGVITGGLGSMISMRRYLREQGSVTISEN